MSAILIAALLFAQLQVKSPPPVQQPASAQSKSKAAAKKKRKKVSPSNPSEEKPKTMANPQIPTLPSAIETVDPTEKKLDSVLLGLVRTVKSKGLPDTKEIASTQKLVDAQNRVKVDITVVGPDSGPRVEAGVRELKGEIVVSLDNRIFAWIPLGAVEAVAAIPEIWSIAVVNQSVSQ